MKKLVSLLMLFAAFSISTKTYAQVYGNTLQDSLDCINNNYIYQDFYNQKNYEDAYLPWNNVLKVCPKSQVNLYIQGTVILKSLISQAKTPEEEQKYLDELLSLYDKRTQAFGQEANNIASKAKDLSEIRPNEKERIYKLYKDAVEKGGKNGIQLDDQFKFLYFKSCCEYLESIKAIKEQMSELFNAYDYSSSALEISLNHAKESGDTKTSVKVESYIDSLEKTIDPFASCEKILSIYRAKYDKDSTNIELIKNIISSLERKGCIKSDLFFKSTESLYKFEPTSKSALMMGQMYANKGDENTASAFFKEALDKAEDNETKTKACFLLAQTLMSLNQYSQARQAFYQVLDYDKSKEGECLFYIASMYLSSSASCASQEGKIRGAAWAAYDKAERAKALDPSIAEKCDSLMRSAIGQWPTKENSSFYEISENQPYTVGCWINEITTVRLR
jgi:hypothetical protein